MSRRRRVAFGLLAAALVVGLLVVGIRWKFPALSEPEWRLVGEWSAPESDPRRGYVTSFGRVTHPWRAWEFRRDRSFRVRVVSADDPRVDIPDVEGRWRVEDGELCLSGFGGIGDALGDVWERVAIRLGRPFLRRITGDGPRHPIRFPDRETFVITVPGEERLTWRRLR